MIKYIPALLGYIRSFVPGLILETVHIPKLHQIKADH